MQIIKITETIIRYIIMYYSLVDDNDSLQIMMMNKVDVVKFDALFQLVEDDRLNILKCTFSLALNHRN